MNFIRQTFLNLKQSIFLLMFVLTSFFANSQLYFPNETFYNNEIERLHLQSQPKGYYGQHLSVKPILDNKTQSDSVYQSKGEYYYWITQKLFKANFIIFKGDDFWCSVDPIIDTELGTDLSKDTLTKLYWNTRGIRVQAKFFEKVSFTTSVYENQAVVPEYQSNYFNKHGEFRPTNLGYKQVNAFIPMYGRTKPFKVSGYDFSFAEGQLSIVPFKWLNFQLGNGSQFIGDGHRSLLLSDFSGNYPFLKTELFAFEGKLQYNLIYASLTNPYRMSLFSTPEATYERKIGVFHYLEYAVNKKLNLSLFEGSNWRSSDSVGTHSPDYLYLTPVIVTNTLIKGTDDKNYNSILGIGANYTINTSKFFTQIVIDNSTISAFQFGFKSYDLLTQKLDFKIEYNQAIRNTYLSENKRYNYSHNNLSLAHPYDNGFKEIISIISYQKNRFFIQNKTIYSSRIKNDTLNIGTNILQSKTNEPLINLNSNNIFLNQFEAGYRFNKNYNLQAVFGYTFRKDNNKSNPSTTNYVYFGIRTRLRNKTLDW
jgi:hypothetical protein